MNGNEKTVYNSGISLKEIEEAVDKDNLRLLASDTIEFRVSMIKEIGAIKKTISGFGCLFDKRTVEAHESKLDELDKTTKGINDFNVKFDKKFDLNALRTKLALESIAESVIVLKKGRDNNSDRIDETEKDIAEIKTTTKVSIRWIIIIWIVSLAFLSGLVVVYDRILSTRLHLDNTPHRETAINEDNESYVFLTQKERDKK